MPDFDLAVVGAGAVGAAAAYAAARAGKRVVLFEQFDVGHERGSSHGESRIIRHSYTSAAYASLAPAAFEAWRALERASGQRLLTMTGSIDIGHRENSAMLACLNALNKAEVGSVFLEGDLACDAYPQFVLRERDAVLWQSGAGILHAGRTVRALVEQAIGGGAVLHERTLVTSVEPGPEMRVRFRSGVTDGNCTASAVVVAAGPWAGRFFEAFGIRDRLRVTHQQVVYYPVMDANLWRLGRCPVYIAHGRDGFYGFPECERPGFIKIAVETEIPIEDADALPLPADSEALGRLTAVVATRLRGIRPEPAEVVTCRCTETADRDFIVDRHPEHPNLVMASPCSGHGFKFSILTGGLAQELATTDESRESLPNWRPQFALDKPAGDDERLGTEWRD